MGRGRSLNGRSGVQSVRGDGRRVLRGGHDEVLLLLSLLSQDPGGGRKLGHDPGRSLLEVGVPVLLG